MAQYMVYFIYVPEALGKYTYSAAVVWSVL